MTYQKSLKEFSDRDLMELLLSNQITIYREIKRLQERIEKGTDKGRGQYWISFKKLLEAKESTIPQINDYLKNKVDADEKYDEDLQGAG